ncbi:allophanate hydrolase [Frankia sp. AgB32]|nr:allophanate hydrolase [Frankia sp. AgB32]MCK9893085.1 allophanate hydrolase [Frankia sp. AgB32]
MADVIRAVYDRIERRGDDAVWIATVPREEALARAVALDTERDALLGPPADRAGGPDDGRPDGQDPADQADLPALFGLPFAVKDNIDVAGLPTTAGCPAFAREPAEDAHAVAALLAAGAVCVGKTNLDQFATGLSGARSPYGTPVSPFDSSMIAGGSSSGSGVAVAVGLVTFAIGTDTAGSGRVPAALSNVVGLKPSRGLVSTRGLVPACRSLDCLSVFALSVSDARLVLSVMNGYDPADPYSRRLPLVPPPGVGSGPVSSPAGQRLIGSGHPPGPGPGPGPGPRTDPSGPGTGRLRVGIARPEDLTFFGDRGARAVHARSLELIRAGGDRTREVDLAPFLAAGALLYNGPWLAERFASVGEFVMARPEQTHPVVRAVLAPGSRISGVDVFRGLSHLRALRQQVDEVWTTIDVLVLPTVPTTYPVEAVLADPIGRNGELGHYTTFVNLLDLAAIAVPAGFADGLPHGVTFIAPAGRDTLLADVATQFQSRAALPLGATGHALVRSGSVTLRGTTPAARGVAAADGTSASPVSPADEVDTDRVDTDRVDTDRVDVAVVGAHMSGLPLNGELVRLGAVLLRRDRTLPRYRLYALPGGPPRRPGLLRVAADGVAIDAEVWRMPVAAVGTFLRGVPAPLAIGTVDLVGGPTLGFLCESAAVAGAEDISELGGWRRFLAGSRSEPTPSRVP